MSKPTAPEAVIGTADPHADPGTDKAAAAWHLYDTFVKDTADAQVREAHSHSGDNAQNTTTKLTEIRDLLTGYPAE